MTFLTTFNQHFDHPPPFEVPAGARDDGHQVLTDPGRLDDELFGLLGSKAFFKQEPGSFLCASLHISPATVTFFLMVIDGERYLYFREQLRDPFNPNASPEACYKNLCKVYGVFSKRPETSFKLVYNLGKLQVIK